MAADPEALTPQETLDVLRANLEPEALEVAATALRAEQERRQQETETRRRYQLIAYMVEGYEHILSSSLAHTQGSLVASCTEYLKTTDPDGTIPEEIDHRVRLYSAYFLASEPHEVEDEWGNYQAMLQFCSVDQDEVCDLLTRYVKARYTNAEDYQALPEHVDNEVFLGMYWNDFLPFPGIIDQLKQDLQEQDRIDLYESVIEARKEANK